MTQDTTTTSGAADLPEALHRVIDDFERRERGIPQAHIAAALVTELRASLAAGQATAAQQGAAYAAQQASTVTNYSTLGAAMRAIRQSIQMIGDPEDECMRAVKRVLRGAVIIVEDSGDEVAAPAAPAQPAAPPSGKTYEVLIHDLEVIASTTLHATVEGSRRSYERDAVRQAIGVIRASHGQAPAQPVDFTTLGAAMRAIQQAIGLIGDPADERMQAVRRVLRGAVVVAEDSGDIPAQPDCLTCNDHGAVGNILTAEPCPDCTRWNVQPAQADSVQEDAARYRWLRDEAHPDGVVNDDIHVHVDSLHYPNRWALLGPELDAAVDAARAAQKEKPHDL